MTDVTCWQLTRGHLGWTVSACFQGTRQSSAYSSLSSGAGSGPHPLECPEQSFALSDTVCPFLVFWRHRGGWRERYREKDKKKKWGHSPNLWLSHCTFALGPMCVRCGAGFRVAGKEMVELDDVPECGWGSLSSFLCPQSSKTKLLCTGLHELLQQ